MEAENFECGQRQRKLRAVADARRRDLWRGVGCGDVVKAISVEMRRGWLGGDRRCVGRQKMKKMKKTQTRVGKQVVSSVSTTEIVLASR